MGGRGGGGKNRGGGGGGKNHGARCYTCFVKTSSILSKRKNEGIFNEFARDTIINFYSLGYFYQRQFNGETCLMGRKLKLT